MKMFLKLIFSSLGRKYIMALSGLGLVGFLVIHMIGNLKIFLGADELNHYAHFLKYHGWILWSFRGGLLALALIHVLTAFSLWHENRAARPQPYGQEATVQATLASVTMAISGSIILIFVIFHLLQFTLKVGPFEGYRGMMAPIHSEGGFFQSIAPVEMGERYPDVFRMVVTGFSTPWIAGFYIVAMGLMTMHLSHGVQSLFQSLGFQNQASAPCLRRLALAVAWILFLGMSVVPAAVWAGFVR